MNTFEVERYSRELRLRIEEMPVGDPMGGTAYGEKLKSKGLGRIIGVVASVATMGAALPMMATGATLATQIAGGAMFAGGALTGIGTVTGNKKLTKMGGILSLAGGLGAMGSNMLTKAGVGGAFAPGSGSTALQKMGGSMMDSVNSIGGKIGLGDIYDPAKVSAATGAGEMAAEGAANQMQAPTMQLEGASQAAAQGVGEQAASAPMLELQSGDTLVSGLGAPAGEQAASAPMFELQNGDTLVGGLKAPAGAELGAGANSGGVLNNAMGLSAPPGSGISLTPPPVAEKGIVESAFEWMKDNAETTKVIAGAVERGATAMMGADEEEKLAALAAQYGAQAELLKTQQEVLEYRKNNMNKQVAMISADDPAREDRVKDAASKGIPVVFIPAIGAGGTGQSGGAWNAATANLAPQTPARPATFGQQPQQA